MGRIAPFPQWAASTAWSGDTVTLLDSARHAESGNSGEVQSSPPYYAKAVMFVLDITEVSGTDPTLDLAIFTKLGDWYVRLLQWTQKTDVFRNGRYLRRDAETCIDPLTLLDDVPIPSANSGYVKESVPWSDIFVIAYNISGTFAPVDPGPPPIPGEGITFSVKAVPLYF